MIAHISTFGRGRSRKETRRDQLLGLRWRCRSCGVGRGFRGADFLYVVSAGAETLLMTFSAFCVPPDSGLCHYVLHVCGEEQAATPLWRRPEWS